MLTMMALSVSIGLLIDDAIVVVESIHRYVQEGHPPLEAASMGVKRVGSAVLQNSSVGREAFLQTLYALCRGGLLADEEERRALHTALSRALSDQAAGRLRTAEEVLEELRPGRS